MVLPLFAPGVNVTVKEPVDVVVEPEIARAPVGGAGLPTMTAGDGTDAAPGPTAFVALTVHV